MSPKLKSLAACTTLFTIVLWIAPPPTLAASRNGAGLEGLVLLPEGRAAAGHRIHLIDSGGEDLAQSEVGKDGLYSFTGLGAGRYFFGVEMPNGTMAPVAAPPVRLYGNELSRRDLKLLTSDASTTNTALQANYGLGHWWSGIPASGKAWTIIGIVLAGWLIYDALDDDESPASPV